VRPVGSRTASWDFSPHTLRITKEMGPALRLLADGRTRTATSSCSRGERPAWSSCRSSGSATDAPYFMMLRFQGVRPQMPTEAVLSIFKREFDMD
jgi:hypothetical protein